LFYAEAMDFTNLGAQWAGLAGFAALIALLINVGKVAGVVKDGQAATWSAGLNLVGLVGLLALQVFKPEVDIAGVDSQVMGLVQVGVVMFTYVLQLLESKLTHIALKGIPVAGKSFSEGG
jgi:hypothetical protein